MNNARNSTLSDDVDKTRFTVMSNHDAGGKPKYAVSRDGSQTGQQWKCKKHEIAQRQAANAVRGVAPCAGKQGVAGQNGTSTQKHESKSLPG